jgi:hypothetical protein
MNDLLVCNPFTVGVHKQGGSQLHAYVNARSVWSQVKLYHLDYENEIKEQTKKG